MDAKTYDELSNSLLAAAREIELAKRPAYTVGDPDPLNNFKSVAQRLGITPRQALAVYMLKHVDAIVSALKDPSIPQGEALEGRFCDLINYTKLAWALVSEEDDRPKAEKMTYETDDETAKYGGSLTVRRFSTCGNCSSALKTRIYNDRITMACEKCGYYDYCSVE